MKRLHTIPGLSWACGLKCFFMRIFISTFELLLPGYHPGTKSLHLVFFHCPCIFLDYFALVLCITVLPVETSRLLFSPPTPSFKTLSGCHDDQCWGCVRDSGGHSYHPGHNGSGRLPALQASAGCEVLYHLYITHVLSACVPNVILL